MDHFRFDADGGIAPRTRAGTYTIRHLRLNRPQLVRRRWELIVQVAHELGRYAEIESDRAACEAMSIARKHKARLLASFDGHAQDCLRRLRRITHPDPAD